MKSGLLFALEQTALKTGFSKSKIMEKALERYLIEIKEDLEDSSLAEKAWSEFAASGERTYTLDEVSKELGI
ncbi:hypothetical protein TPE_0332 [Treponema pedis str. T A4]|uniref:CopG family transcriptional regulator n=2 Tax=Treponema pedis TaxID=409322 RepID=S5ZXX5_9SPIR|nr:hypothetical protein TPE_0332 [Treponema pedis str. T A4]